MTTDVQTTDPDVPAREAADRLLEQDIGSLIVEGDETGIITKTDLVTGLRDGKNPDETRVSELMTSQLVTIHIDSNLQTAVDLMEEHRIRRLPVTARGSVVGIVTTTDLVEELAVDFDSLVGMFAETFTPDSPNRYECVHCGHRETAEHQPEICANCGEEMITVSVPRE